MPSEDDDVRECRVVDDLDSTNKIYFSSYVDEESICKLDKIITEKTFHMMDLANRYDIAPPPIHLIINSPGGDTVSGFAACDMIAKNRVPIYTVVKGCAASSASMMSIAGHRRFIYENSFIMIHDLQSLWGDWLKFHEIKNEEETLVKFHDTMRDTYLKFSKFQKSRMEDLLKKDIYYNAKEALKWGLVDVII